MNEELLAAYRDAIQSAEDLGELDEVVGGLPSEEYEDALAEDIEGRREELKSERIDPDSMTRAELVDLLENRPELRSAASDVLEGSETEDENRKPDPGSPPNPTRDGGQPDPGSAEDDMVMDAKSDWESAGSSDLDTTGDPDGDWDGSDALDQLMSEAEDGDGNVDKSFVERGVAAVNSEADGNSKEDYKGPFAVVQDGEPVADLSGADSLKKMAGQMDVPESVQEDAKELADSYLPDDEEDDTEDQTQDPEELVIDDEIEDKVSYENGKLSFEAEVVTDTTINTLTDTAERLGVDVEEDPNPEELITAINQRASKVDTGSTPDRSTPDARSLFQRLEDHGTRL